jgi:hypothetical protein
MMDAGSEFARLMAGSKVDICGRRTDNGRAGILCDHQASKAATPLVIRERQTRLDEERGTVLDRHKGTLPEIIGEAELETLNAG